MRDQDSPAVHTTIDHKWRRYVIGKRILWGGFLLYLPVGGGLAALAHHLGFEQVSIGIAGTWMLALAANALWLGGFRCPRCEKEFFVLTSWLGGLISSSNILATRCVHCRLRLADERAAS